MNLEKEENGEWQSVDFCPGEYRLVVFVGDSKVYAPFKVVE